MSLPAGVRDLQGRDAARSASSGTPPTAPRTTPLRAQGLAIGWDPARPLAVDLDLELRAGELVCLLGPNGVGKSTLLRTLAGLQTPLGGTVELDGRALGAWSPRERARRLAVVLTERALPGMVTGVELVRLGRQPYTPWSGRLEPADHAAVDAALEAVDAAALGPRPLGEISDGERQKVMIARALAQEAETLILDEPTAFLDLPRRAEILRLLRRLAHGEDDEGRPNARPRAVLLSTHDLDLALRAADRLWLLGQSPGDPLGGRRVHAGIPEELVLDGTFAEVFAAEGIDFDAASGSFSVRRRIRGRVRLLDRSSDDPLPAVWTRRALERAGWTIDPQAPTIVEVLPGSTWRLEDGAEARELVRLADLLEALERQSPRRRGSQSESSGR